MKLCIKQKHHLNCILFLIAIAQPMQEAIDKQITSSVNEALAQEEQYVLQLESELSILKKEQKIDHYKAESRAVRWRGSEVAPEVEEMIVALCCVGGSQVFRSIIHIDGIDWKRTASHFGVKKWCSHEDLAKSAEVE